MEAFFEERSTASRVKHELLLRYLPVFATKTTHWRSERRAYYLDGYAGPGMYDDKSPGSPLVAAEVAELLEQTSVNVRSQGPFELVGIFIEENRDSAMRLRENLDSVGRDDWVVMVGRSDERLGDAMELAEGAPLLVFLDPYGLGIPFDMLVDTVLARAARAKTEVLLNVSHRALARVGGFLDVDWQEIDRPDDVVDRLQSQQSTLLTRMDAVLGGSWWRDVKRSQPWAWHETVRDGFVQRVNERTDGLWLSYSAPVPQRWKGPAVYDLLLFSRHPHGPWKFNEATAKTFNDLYRSSWVSENDQLSLFSVQPDAIPDPRSEYIEKIKRNILVALRTTTSFGVAEGISLLLCDDTRGLAGPREVRLALQDLHDVGKVGGDRPLSRGLENYVITRGPQFGE